MVTTAPLNDGSDRRAIAVGTEFVRQYYTVLNSSPNSVFRFYSGDSAFVYGGVDRPGCEQLPVRGQNNIYQRILEIGFVDPRCKILQIDAMFSEANCVLVQVCGELSNDSGPMRRFMQTFLLKPKGEKAYYVLNSIFRYQDEVFGDDVDDAASSVVEEQRVGMDGGNNFNMASAVTEEKKMNGSTAPLAYDGLSQTSLPVTDAAIVSMSNGDVNGDSTYEDMKASLSEIEKDATIKEENVEEMASLTTDIKTEVIIKESESCVVPQEPPKPKSWADLVNRQAVNVAPVRRAAPVQQQAEQAKVEPAAINGSAQHEHAVNGDQHPRRGFAPQSGVSNGQIFVGNLMPEVTEAELTEFFSTFGEVEHVRINQGNPSKAAPGRREVLNFGFVVFRDSATVSAVLSAKPLIMGDRRINVEEKKVAPQGTGFGGRSGRGSGGFRSRGAGARGGAAQSERVGGGSRGGSGGPRNN